MALAVGPRPARLAHRVLGDVTALPGRGVRHPRRRGGPGVPAPRERGRAGGGGHWHVRAALAPQRPGAARRREDVEVDRQRRDGRRGAGALAARRAAPLRPRQPLPEPGEPHRRGAHGRRVRRGTACSRPCGVSPHPRQHSARRRRASARRSTYRPSANRFVEALEDDLGTPQALAAVFDLARAVNRGRDAGHDVRAPQATLAELARDVLGLRLEEPDAVEVLDVVALSKLASKHGVSCGGSGRGVDDRGAARGPHGGARRARLRPRGRESARTSRMRVWRWRTRPRGRAGARGGSDAREAPRANHCR